MQTNNTAISTTSGSSGAAGATVTMPNPSTIATWVISLRNRPNRTKLIKQHLRNQNIRHNIYLATPHKNPKRGCLESHLHLITLAIRNGLKYIMILEDDALFIRSMTTMEPLPENFHMAYLGGTVHRRIGELVPGWVRALCWTTHAYILNLTDPTFCEALLRMRSYEGEVDRYYIQEIQPHFNCYIHNPMIAIQRPGFSDIEQREVNYSEMQNTLLGLRQLDINDLPSRDILFSDATMSSLPYVSIVTPTYNRRTLFPIALRNWKNFVYPADRMEWIIVDDSPTPSLEDLLPNDPRIKYYHSACGEAGPSTVAAKRNQGVALAQYDFIVMMDDDDYYPPESVLFRVKMLMDYPEHQCVGSSRIGVYHLLTQRSTITSDSPMSLSEATMAFRKSMWQERPFDPAVRKGEHHSFIQGRTGLCMNLPYPPIIVAINHNSNMTESLRIINDKNCLRNVETGLEMSFYEMWDEDTQDFFTDMKSYLQRRTAAVVDSTA